MTALEAILDEINRKYGFIATVVVKRDGRFLVRVGDAREPVWNDPYNIFFRDAETIANAFAFLDAAPPPHILGQGDRSVILLKPREDVLLGAVKEDHRDAIETWQLCRTLQQELSAWLADVDLDADRP